MGARLWMGAMFTKAKKPALPSQLYWNINMWEVLSILVQQCCSAWLVEWQDMMWCFLIWRERANESSWLSQCTVEVNVNIWLQWLMTKFCIFLLQVGGWGQNSGRVCVLGWAVVGGPLSDPAVLVRWRTSVTSGGLALSLLILPPLNFATAWPGPGWVNSWHLFVLELNSELSLLQSYAEERCCSVCICVSSVFPCEWNRSDRKTQITAEILCA